MATKTKQIKKAEEEIVSEESLLKALDELQDAVVEKSDPVLAQDPEGGLPKVGTPLSGKAGRSGEHVAKMMSASDEDDDSDNTSSDDGSDDDDDDDDDDSDTRKSLRERAERDGEMRKAFNASDFLDSFVTLISEHFEAEFNGLAKALVSHGTAVRAEQSEFNKKLAKGFVVLSEEMASIARSLATIKDRLSKIGNGVQKALNSPVDYGNRPMVLEKGDIVDPHEETEQNSLLFTGHPLDEVPSDLIKGWLYQKVDTTPEGKLRKSLEDVVMIFEANRYNPRALPSNLVSEIVRDLRSAE